MDRFGPYRIERELGQSPAAVVYRAVPESGDLPVALKVFRSRLGDDLPEPAAWEAQFRREAAAAQRLVHPNVVRTIAAGITQRRPWVALELVEGRSLAAALGQGEIDLARKTRIAAEVATALQAAHEEGVLHLALRPANVFLQADGQVRVSDFGGLELLAAPVVSSGSRQSGQVPYRAQYRAPEQVLSRRPDSRTDIFGLGVLFYEMVFRRLPFDGDSWFQVTQRILNVAPPVLRDSSGELPLPILRVLDRALAKDPIDRFQTAAEMRRALIEAGAELARSSADLPAPRRPAPAGQARLGAFLVLDTGEPEARTFPLAGSEFSLGRRSDNDLRIRDENVSRYHARIAREDGEWFLVDLDSRHGTWLNGTRIRRARLADGDRIQLGSSRRARILFRAGEPTAHDGTGTAEPVFRERDLLLLLDFAQTLNSTLALDAVLGLTLDAALELTGHERGFVLLVGTGGQPEVRLGRHRDLRDIAPGQETISMSLIKRSHDTLAPASLSEDPALSRTESMVALRLKSVLCFPLVAKGAVRGFVYLDSREGQPALDAAQRRLLDSFAATAAMAVENARLYELMIRDPLLGLFRRDYFDYHLQVEFERASRSGQPLSLLFADIDRFKAINDRFLHTTGDEVLREVGRVVRSHARSTDIAARWGGEEIVVLAPATSRDDARRLAERIREEVQRIRLPLVGGQTLDVTLSVGVASWPGPGIDRGEDLVARADACLLEAKRTGRNRVVDSLPEPA